MFLFSLFVVTHLIAAVDTNSSCNLACRNGGSCILNGTKPQCYCTLKWEGDSCQFPKDACYDNPCKNNGICLSHTTDYGYTCNCTANFTGSTCNKHNSCKNFKCGADKVCKISNGTAVCVCNKMGFDEKCEDVDECSYNGVCGYNSICINTLGSYYCNCSTGWVGKRCENNIDFCINVTCYNGGTCTDQLTNFKCSCGAGYTGPQCNQTIKGCTTNSCKNGGVCESGTKCLCGAGFTGPTCETTVVCPATLCKNGGTCKDVGGSSQCICVSGFVGSYCETNPNDCVKGSCNNGTCIDGLNKYSCDCKAGFSGPRCNININECLLTSTPCLNNGRCMDGVNKYFCACPDKYTGVRCEKYDYCTKNCQNGGTCVEIAGSYQCNCTDGFKGDDCSEKRVSCPYNDCHHSFDGSKCNRKCNIPECNFDEGDCTLGVLSPWENCTVKHCWSVFGDGVCNKECNSPLCLNDGNDCMKVKNCTMDASCRSYYNNSKCDESCNTVECGFDGDDCREETKTVPGKLIFTLISTREQFEYNKVDFVRSLSAVLNSHVTIDKIEELSSNSSRKRRSSSPKLRITTSMANTKSCKDQCFKSTRTAAKYLAAKASKGTLKLPVALYSVQSTKGPGEPKEKAPLSMLSIVLICIAIPTVVMVVIIGGKRVHTTLWAPEGHRRHASNSMRREPGVGQEGDEMTSLKQRGDSPDSESITGSSATSENSPIDCKRFKPDVVGTNNDWIPPLREQRPSVPVIDSSDGCSIPSPVTYDYRSTNHGESNMHFAARFDKAELCNQLINMGFDLNAKDKDGRSPLHLAISSLATYVFKLLVHNRLCHIDLQANDGCTPLMDACRSSSHFMVDDLISTGAKVNLTDNQGYTALHHAARVDNSKSAFVLLKNVAKVDAQNSKGETPLFLAAREGCYATAVVLLQNFANRNAADNMDRTPLAIATIKGHKDLISLLKGCASTPSPMNSPPPVSPTYSDIRPKLVASSHLPVQFEPAHSCNKPPTKRKRKASSKKDKMNVKNNIVADRNPYQFQGIETYSAHRHSPVRDIVHDLNDQQDILMQSFYNVPDCMDSWQHQNMNSMQPTINLTNVDMNFMHHPFPTPPSAGMQSPNTELDIDFNHSIFLTPSPESFATTSPDSGTSMC